MTKPVPLEPGSFEQIQAADDTAAKAVDVPEWSMQVTVRGFRRAEALQWSATDDPSESDALVIHYGLVQPTVTIEQAREIVAAKSQVAVARIVREVIELSGLGTAFHRGADG